MALEGPGTYWNILDQWREMRVTMEHTRTDWNMIGEEGGNSKETQGQRKKENGMSVMTVREGVNKGSKEKKIHVYDHNMYGMSVSWSHDRLVTYYWPLHM